MDMPYRMCGLGKVSENVTHIFDYRGINKWISDMKTHCSRLLDKD
jgi:hypothetical protein